MNISLDKQPGCSATVSVEIPAEKVSEERAKIMNSFLKEAKVPGFRPGKAPVAVIEKRFGEQVSQELDSRLFRLGFDKVLKDNEDLKVLEAKNPRDVMHNEDGSFSFATELVLAPEFELPDYKGLEIEIPKPGVSDEMIDGQLEQVRERFADYEDLTDRALAMGDLAVIDYTSTVDGKPMDEVGGPQAKPLSSNENYWIRIAEEAFFPGFTEELVGLKADDKKDITVTLPEDFPIADLREKEAVFAVVVKGAKSETVPELNDEFAEKLQPGSSMQDIRDLIRNDLETQQNRQVEEVKIDRVLEKLHGMVDFELPADFVKSETQGQADQMVKQSMEQGATREQLAENQEELFAAAGERARTNVKTNFLLQRIAEAESLDVSESELLQRVTMMAKQQKTPLKKFIKNLQKHGQVSGIRNNLLLGKSIDFLLEHAKVTEVEPQEEASKDDE